MSEASSQQQAYDCIVVGAGHAGVEAALAAARLGVETLAITINLDTVAQMSCNPSIGGVAKGQLVKEIDALGGEIGRITDKTMMQFRMLNRSKGRAVWAPRAQADKYAYRDVATDALYAQEHLTLTQDIVSALIVEEANGAKRVCGVVTERGNEYVAKTVILTTGTFLNGLIHIGEYQKEGGRIGELPAKGLSEALAAMGFEVGRLKTGTPARVDEESIDFSLLERQEGDNEIVPFSYLSERIELEQHPCHIVYTDERIHELIRENMHRSPLYGGRIKGVGPRYCPSIEDKVVRFSDKPRHQLFLEKESHRTNELYVNGFSTSLPEDVQIRMLRALPGFHEARVLKPAYAIEYDFCNPQQIAPTLETKHVRGLFFAGQINGTSGYEEAAAQGLIAGVNAALQVKGEEPFVLGRSEAYIGVLIDDLTTKGTNEPYRMFTSRAEYRMLLRQDNADVRLTERAHRIGLASDERLRRCREKQEGIARLSETLSLHFLRPDEFTALGFTNEAARHKRLSAKEMLKRPEVTIDRLRTLSAIDWDAFPRVVLDATETEIKYEGYVANDLREIEKVKKYENMRIPDDFDYDALEGVKTEAKEKLKKVRPYTLAQAYSISGVDFSVLHVLMAYVRKGGCDG